MLASVHVPTKKSEFPGGGGTNAGEMGAHEGAEERLWTGRGHPQVARGHQRGQRIGGELVQWEMVLQEPGVAENGTGKYGTLARSRCEHIPERGAGFQSQTASRSTDAKQVEILEVMSTLGGQMFDSRALEGFRAN